MTHILPVSPVRLLRGRIPAPTCKKNTFSTEDRAVTTVDPAACLFRMPGSRRPTVGTLPARMLQPLLSYVVSIVTAVLILYLFDRISLADPLSYVLPVVFGNVGGETAEDMNVRVTHDPVRGDGDVKPCRPRGDCAG